MTDGLVRGQVVAGTVLGGRYRVDALIGRGGMASVYRASDQVLGRDVAIKRFGDASDDEAHAARAATEVRVLAALNHHSLVTLFDAQLGTSEDAYLVMELVDGPTLRDRIASSPIAADDIAAMAVDLAEALAAVHGAGMVHRDVKPSNVLLAPSVSSSREFRAKLADFGIAHLVDSARLTTPGTIMGTAAYLSPEQTQGVTPAPAGDVYSLGLVLLESFTRERAFPGGMTESLVARTQRDPFVPGDLGYGWKSLLTAMTARTPENRPTALEVVDTARSLLGSSRPTPIPLADTAHLAPISETTPIDVPHGGLDDTAAMTATALLDAPRDDVRRARRAASRTPRSRSRRRLVIAGAAVVVAAGLGTGLTALVTGGSRPVAASDTSTGVTLPDLAAIVGQFHTGFESVLSARQAEADATSDVSGESAVDTNDGSQGGMEAPAAPAPSSPVEPEPSDPVVDPGAGKGAGPGNGNDKGAGNGNNKGAGNENGKSTDKTKD